MHDFADAPFVFHMPTQVVFGRGCVRSIGEHVAPLGTRAVLVTMPELPMADSVRADLEAAGIETTVFTQVKPNPIVPMVDEGARVAREVRAQVVIGLGGGSAMDTAKGIAVGATHDGSVWEYVLDYAGETREPTPATLPIVAIPTTAGTGAEVSGVAVLGNPNTKQKGPIRNGFIFPRIALVDPELTFTMPPRLTASSGFDAFTHGFERLMSCVSHPFVDAIAQSAMAAVVETLETAVADGDNADARVRMSWASCQATMCVAAKLGEAGLHVMGLPLSAHLDVPHGESMAVLLGHMLVDAAEYLPDQCLWLAHLFGEEPGGGDIDALASACYRGVTRWLERIDLNIPLTEYGVDEAMCTKLAESVNLSRFENTFYRSRTRDEVEAFYRRVMLHPATP